MGYKLEFVIMEGGSMVKLKSEYVKEYLEQGKEIIADLAINIYGKSLNKVGEEAFSEAIEIGIENTISSLYDADVGDDEIIRVLNKFWGINKNEAESRIIYEKSEATIRELKYYLKMQGWCNIKIEEFMKINMVYSKIKHNNELWKLRHKPEKLIQELKRGK